MENEYRIRLIFDQLLVITQSNQNYEKGRFFLAMCHFFYAVDNASKMWEIQLKCLCMYRSVDFSPLNRIKAIRPYFGIYVSFSVSTILMGNIVRKDKNQDATFANVLLFEDFYCLEHSGKEGGGQHQKWVQTYFSNCFCYWRTYY